MARHAALADLLRDLGGDGDRLALELDVHLERVVDLGQRVGRELDVDDRAGDRDDAAVLQCRCSRVRRSSVMAVAPRARCRYVRRVPDVDSTVSTCSSTWSAVARAQRLGAADDLHDLGGDRVLAGAVHDAGVRLVIRSSALSVAAFIARWRAACSDAAAFSSAA